MKKFISCFSLVTFLIPLLSFAQNGGERNGGDQFVGEWFLSVNQTLSILQKDSSALNINEQQISQLKNSFLAFSISSKTSSTINFSTPSEHAYQFPDIKNKNILLISQRKLKAELISMIDLYLDSFSFLVELLPVNWTNEKLELTKEKLRILLISTEGKLSKESSFRLTTMDLKALLANSEKPSFVELDAYYSSLSEFYHLNKIIYEKISTKASSSMEKKWKQLLETMQEEASEEPLLLEAINAIQFDSNKVVNAIEEALNKKCGNNLSCRVNDSQQTVFQQVEAEFHYRIQALIKTIQETEFNTLNKWSGEQ